MLRSFYESSVMAMGVIELTEETTRFISANTVADQFFGLTPGKLEGMTDKELRAPPEMTAAWIERFRECRSTGRPIRFEYAAACSTSPTWVAATLSPMCTPGSDRVLCSFIVEDITDRKRAEQGLRLAKELAEAACRASDRFLAVLSHELRTPLTPVLIAVSSLLKSKPTPSLLPTLEMIHRNIELEARLIDDLLDLSRFSRGQLRLDLEVIDIHEAIGRAIEICRNETSCGRPGSRDRAGRPAAPRHRRPRADDAGRLEPDPQCRQVHPGRRKAHHPHVKLARAAGL